MIFKIFLKPFLRIWNNLTTNIFTLGTPLCKGAVGKLYLKDYWIKDHVSFLNTLHLIVFSSMKAGINWGDLQLEIQCYPKPNLSSKKYQTLETSGIEPQCNWQLNVPLNIQKWYGCFSILLCLPRIYQYIAFYTITFLSNLYLSPEVLYSKLAKKCCTQNLPKMFLS